MQPDNRHNLIFLTLNIDPSICFGTPVCQVNVGSLVWPWNSLPWQRPLIHQKTKVRFCTQFSILPLMN